MPIKNYTTKIDVYTSLGEIQGALARNGASKVMIDYNGAKPEAVTFGIVCPDGRTAGFRLVARVEGVENTFRRQKVRADREQAERTAWRNVRDWVLAQMAMIESEQAELDELFLQRMLGDGGRTLYEVYKDGQLLLEDGKGEK